MAKYIWQYPGWPKFTWDDSILIKCLAGARKAQGHILGQAKFLQLKEQAEILVEETLATSAIEGEKLDREGVRSSVAKRLGLSTAGLSEAKRNGDGVVEVLLDATVKHAAKLNDKRLFGWQAALFPTGYSGIDKINTGNWRTGKEPMQVVSGRMGNAKVHYEAPPSKEVVGEMKVFFQWWNSKSDDLDGILRAAIAHFWFVTIHPFDDGNGRIARAITDMALAQDERTSLRLYSLSSQIIKERKTYYNILERTQKGKGDITEWLKWFLEMFTRSIQNSNKLIEKAIFASKLYEYCDEQGLNDRQRKVVKRMLESFPDDFIGGLTNQKYVSMTKISPETAKRDIRDLVQKKILIQNEGGGRSTSYQLNRNVAAVNEN